MKLGILGTGMIVKDLLTTIHELKIESIYILGTQQTEEETKSLCEQYHLDGYDLNYDDLLKRNIDTIYVALPNHLHYTFAKKALENGKHVIIEKPITANTFELKELIKIAKTKHLFMMEAMNIHYLPAYQTLKENIHRIGQPKIVSFNYSQYSSRYDDFKQNKIHPAFDYHKAGGALMDLNVYNIHGIVGLFGKPKRIQYLANIEKQIDTSGILTLDYGNFKAVLVGAKDCKAPIMTSVQGDQGCILLDTPANNVSNFQLLKNDKRVFQYNEQDGKHRMYFEFVEFVKIIDKKDYQRAQDMMEKSLIAMTIATKARQSANVIFPADIN